MGNCYNFVSIGDTKLAYVTNSNKYIATLLDEIAIEDITEDLKDIYESIMPMYRLYGLEFSNTCGQNAEYICKNLKKENVKLGKIIITKWQYPINDKLLEQIEHIYGTNSVCIGASYHALTYLEITNTVTKSIYYVALHSTSEKPYKLQFYIANNYEKLTDILKVRYLCDKISMTFDYKKSWTDFI